MENITTIKNYFDIDEINKITGYFTKYADAKNNLIFTIGVNSWLTLKDIVSLRFRDLMNEDWTYKKEIPIGEHTLYVNDFLGKSILSYFSSLDSIHKNDIIFGTENNESFMSTLNTVVGELGLNVCVNSDILRKTFAHQLIVSSPDKDRVIEVFHKNFGFETENEFVEYIFA